MKTSLYTVALFIVGLALSSCTQSHISVPKGILPPDTLISILVDIHLVDAILHEQNNDPTAKRNAALYLYPSLLEKHHVSRVEVDSSIVHYTRRPNEFAQMYEKVIAELNRRRDSLGIENDEL